MKYILQSLLIPRSLFTLNQAKKWIKDNNYKDHYQNKSVHITKNYYRFRQHKPNKNLIYKTKKLPNGITLILQRI